MPGALISDRIRSSFDSCTDLRPLIGADARRGSSSATMTGDSSGRGSRTRAQLRPGRLSERGTTMKKQAKMHTGLTKQDIKYISVRAQADKIKRLEQEIKALKQRIADLETGAAPAEDPCADL